VTWADIGALDGLRKELSMTIYQPIKNRKQFEAIGLSVPAGVLLYGPPGCGKTLVAKAIANESGASFLSIKGPELLNQYVGASEKAVRQVLSIYLSIDLSIYRFIYLSTQTQHNAHTHTHIHTRHKNNSKD